MDKVVCTIKRSTWARGGKNGPPRLLNYQGNMCCLGFLGETCGVSLDEMSDISIPNNLGAAAVAKYPTLTNPLISWNAFSGINDEQYITDDKREERLEKLAEENGFTFVFVD